MASRIFSERIKQLCTEKSVSFDALVKHLDMSAGGLHRCIWGSNALSLENCIKLADLFDVSLDYLVGRTDSPDVAYKPKG